MAEVTLEVTRRERSGKEYAKKLRQENKIPAVVYGGHKEPVAITVERKAVSELIQKSQHGVRSIFLLKMSGTDQQRHAMIKDIQMDPISRRMTHIECLPGAIPDAIEVDVTNLGVHDYIRIADLTLPEGVKVLDDPDRVVVGV